MSALHKRIGCLLIVVFAFNLNACTVPNIDLGLVSIEVGPEPEVTVKSEGQKTYYIEVLGAAGQEYDYVESVFEEKALATCQGNHGLNNYNVISLNSGFSGVETLLVKNSTKVTIACR